MRIPGKNDCPDAIRDLNLDLPALLEASAGTGKTYAIEHLVLRILKEKKDEDLSKILVLTFTEKATGELKDKIRKRLGAEWSANGFYRAELNGPHAGGFAAGPRDFRPADPDAGRAMLAGRRRSGAARAALRG